jgi:hypothetical protein
VSEGTEAFCVALWAVSKEEVCWLLCNLLQQENFFVLSFSSLLLNSLFCGKERSLIIGGSGGDVDVSRVTGLASHSSQARRTRINVAVRQKEEEPKNEQKREKRKGGKEAEEAQLSWLGHTDVYRVHGKGRGPSLDGRLED